MPSIQTKCRITSGITLLCAAELGARVMRRVAGGDIANTINGATASKEVVQTYLLQRITNRLLGRKQS